MYTKKGLEAIRRHEMAMGICWSCGGRHPEGCTTCHGTGFVPPCKPTPTEPNKQKAGDAGSMEEGT
jgi:hypothetical protein